MSPDRTTQRRAVQAFETIREEIISGALAPNMPISEAELSERLGVSRTPVREALIKLAEDNLVRIVPQVGTFVAPISVPLVKESQFIREHLECALVVEAAKHIDELTIRRLRDNLEDQARAVRDNDRDRFYVLDDIMHGLLADAAGYPTMWRVIQQKKIHMDRVRRVSFGLPNHMAQLLVQHQAIVDAVIRGDGAAAQAALRAHLWEIFGTLETLGLNESSDAAPPVRKR